jgi:hypothetical protein
MIKKFLHNSYQLRYRLKLTAKNNALFYFFKRLLISEKTDVFKDHQLFKKRDRSIVDHLILAPIDYGGLTVQLEQIIKIYTLLDIKFEITWYAQNKNIPEYNHLNNLFISYELAKKKKYKSVFYFERFPIYWKESFNIFYVNIDQLSRIDLFFSRICADLILYPIKYKSEFFKRFFKFQEFEILSWPSQFENSKSNVDLYIEDQTSIDNDNNVINILYIGKNTSHVDRKNLNHVINAIIKNNNPNLKFTIKIIGEISNFEKIKIELCCRSKINLIEKFLSKNEISKLYDDCDLVLIPNSSEGNGLTINEAIEKNKIPIIINGSPMNQYLNTDSAYLIDPNNFIRKNYARYYEVDEKNILQVLNSITIEKNLNKKKKLLEIKDQFYTPLEIFESKINKKLNNYINKGNFYIKNFKMTDLEYKNKLKKNIFLLITTTSKRFDLFLNLIKQVESAINNSIHDFYVDIIIDGPCDDKSKYHTVLKNLPHNICFNTVNLGLPFVFKNLKNKITNIQERLMYKFHYIAYFQDDINYIDINYFDNFVNYSEIFNYDDILFLTGYKSDLHVGKFFHQYKDKKIYLNSSIDGKNFFIETKKFLKIQSQPPLNSKLRRHGNPGPLTGSNFDLWYSFKAPFAKSKKNITFENYIQIDPSSKLMKNSTWKNSEEDNTIKQRLKLGKYYS